MKNFFTLICFFLISFCVLGQKRDTVVCITPDPPKVEKAYNPELEIEKFPNLGTFIKKGYTVGTVTVKDGFYDIIYFTDPSTPKRTKITVRADSSYVVSRGTVNNFSLITIPFKVRPGLKANDDRDAVPQMATSSLKTVGLLWARGRSSDKFYVDGKVRNRKSLFGLFLAPSVEEFNLKNTNGKHDGLNQLVLSTGLAWTYTYNAITFSVIPLGFDFGLTSPGKDWVHNAKPWFGFGLGIDVKFLSL